MHQGKILYQLQERDLAAAKHAQRLQAIHAKLQDHAAVQQAQQQLEQAQAYLRPLQTRMNDTELQIQATQNKREKTEQRLYSGSVTHPKELQDMQHEIEALKQRRSALDDTMLELMLAVEEAQATLDESQQRLDDAIQTAAEENKELLKEKEDIQLTLNALQAERQAFAQELSDDILARYEQMRPQKGNQPVARLLPDNTCSVCGIQQIGPVAENVRKGEGWHTCTSCKRLLVHLG